MVDEGESAEVGFPFICLESHGMNKAGLTDDDMQMRFLLQSKSRPVCSYAIGNGRVIKAPPQIVSC